MSKTIKKAMAKLGLKRQKMTWPEMAIEFIETLRPHSAETPLIRIGGDGDGAYLIPDDLEGLVGCYSPGVAGLSIFEREFANRGMKVSVQILDTALPVFWTRVGLFSGHGSVCKIWTWLFSGCVFQAIV